LCRALVPVRRLAHCADEPALKMGKKRRKITGEIIRKKTISAEWLKIIMTLKSSKMSYT